jgi:hypothetical protein
LLSALESEFTICSYRETGDFVVSTSALYVANWCTCLRPEKLVAHAPVEALTKAVLHRLSRGNQMLDDLLSCVQASMAFEVNPIPLSDTIMPGLPRRSIKTVSSRATRRPGIEVSGIAAKHSRITSSTMFRMGDRRPRAGHGQNPETAGVGSRLDQDRRPRPYCAPPSTPLAHSQALFAIEPVDPVDPGRFAVLPQQDEQGPFISARMPVTMAFRRGARGAVLYSFRDSANNRSEAYSPLPS